MQNMVKSRSYTYIRKLSIIISVGLVSCLYGVHQDFITIKFTEDVIAPIKIVPQVLEHSTMLKALCSGKYKEQGEYTLSCTESNLNFVALRLAILLTKEAHNYTMLYGNPTQAYGQRVVTALCQYIEKNRLFDDNNDLFWQVFDASLYLQSSDVLNALAQKVLREYGKGEQLCQFIDEIEAKNTNADVQNNENKDQTHNIIDTQMSEYGRIFRKNYFYLYREYLDDVQPWLDWRYQLDDLKRDHYSVDMSTSSYIASYSVSDYEQVASQFAQSPYLFAIDSPYKRLRRWVKLLPNKVYQELETAYFENTNEELVRGISIKTLIDDIDAYPDDQPTIHYENGELDISRRNINSLEGLDELLDQLDHPIRRINLSHNLIEVLDKPYFKEFRHLDELWSIDLSHNHIREIKDSVFDGCEKSVTNIDLSHNQLTNNALSHHALAHLDVLQVLHLEYNYLSSIPTGMFTQFPKLRYLALKHNRIISIEKDAFPDFTAHEGDEEDEDIRYIDLSNNLIQTLENGVFSFATKSDLTQLLLDNNRISTIEPEAFGELYTGDEPVRGFELNLSGNRLEMLDENFLKGYGGTVLDLSRNHIRHIHPYAFNAIGNKIKTLYISSNYLKTIPHEVCQAISANNTVIDLENNLLSSTFQDALVLCYDMHEQNFIKNSTIDVAQINYRQLRRAVDQLRAAKGRKDISQMIRERLEQLKEKRIARKYFKVWKLKTNQVAPPSKKQRIAY